MCREFQKRRPKPVAIVIDPRQGAGFALPGVPVGVRGGLPPRCPCHPMRKPGVEGLTGRGGQPASLACRRRRSRRLWRTCRGPLNRATSSFPETVPRAPASIDLQEIEEVLHRESRLVEDLAKSSSTQSLVVRHDEDDGRKIRRCFSPQDHVTSSLTPKDEADLLKRSSHVAP